MSSLALSIIIPCYNHANWISKTLDSISAQNMQCEFEVILINDKSTDSFAASEAELLKKYPWLKIINNDKNIGQAASRNIGAETSQGRYLMFLDADDELVEGELLKVITWLEQQDNPPELILSTNRIVHQDGTVVTKPPTQYSENPIENLEKYIFGNAYFCQGSYLILREKFLEIKFNESLKIKEDALFYMLMLLNCSVKGFPDPMVNYFLARGAVRTNQEENIKLGFKVETLFFEDQKAKNLPSKIKNKIYLRRCNRLMKTAMKDKDYKSSIEYYKEVIKYCPSLRFHHQLLRKYLQSSLKVLFS